MSHCRLNRFKVVVTAVSVEMLQNVKIFVRIEINAVTSFGMDNYTDACFFLSRFGGFPKNLLTGPSSLC